MILKRKSIVTLNILYWMPDYQDILQEFVWQTRDVKPEYPRVHKFLNYWHENIDAVISEVLLCDEYDTSYRIQLRRFIMDKEEEEQGHQVSKGERSNVNKKVCNAMRSDTSQLQRAINQREGLVEGKERCCYCSKPKHERDKQTIY